MTKLVRHAITEAAEDHEPNDEDKQRITFPGSFSAEAGVASPRPFSVGDALGVFDNFFLLILVSRYITPSRRFTEWFEDDFGVLQGRYRRPHKGSVV